MQTDLARLLTLLGSGEQWKSMAACGSAEPDLFFPISAATSNQLQVAEAKVVCGRCLVRRECLDFAIRTRQMHGIWGGMTEEERYSAVKAHQQQVVSAVAPDTADAHPRYAAGHSSGHR